MLLLFQNMPACTLAGEKLEVSILFWDSLSLRGCKIVCFKQPQENVYCCDSKMMCTVVMSVEEEMCFPRCFPGTLPSMFAT